MNQWSVPVSKLIVKVTSLWPAISDLVLPYLKYNKIMNGLSIAGWIFYPTKSVALWYTVVMFHIVALNSLWSSDTISWHGSGSTLAHVMAWCLMAPSHYLNQCWSQIISTKDARDYFAALATLPWNVLMLHWQDDFFSSIYYFYLSPPMNMQIINSSH